VGFWRFRFDDKWVVLHRGQRREIGGVAVTVLAPPAHVEGLKINDQSLVLSLTFGENRLLFTGDMGRRGEEDVVVAANGTLASAVLKVPHHGSDTSSSPAFLDAVAPRYAIVSAGFENRFGFPHQSVLRRYSQRGCRIARTDLDGAVYLRLNERGEIDMATEKFNQGPRRRP
jgi:competence protein ComEC